MTFLQSIILGIVQGLTEFLPVSSSAHLVLVPYLLNWSLDPQVAFAFDVLVQLGTLGAVIIYFWKDLLNMLRAWINGLRSRQPFSEPDSRLAWLILLATIPAGLAGLLLALALLLVLAVVLDACTAAQLVAVFHGEATVFGQRERLRTRHLRGHIRDHGCLLVAIETQGLLLANACPSALAHLRALRVSATFTIRGNTPSILIGGTAICAGFERLSSRSIALD